MSYRKTLVAAGGAALLAATVVPLSGAVAANPPGNNGTVKIDGVAFDDAPDNEPHVGCGFEVDWYGFDEGDLYSDVTFEAQPPSGTGVILTDRVFIGEDDNSGGGSEAGLDASAFYNLGGPVLGQFKEHPIVRSRLVVTPQVPEGLCQPEPGAHVGARLEVAPELAAQ